MNLHFYKKISAQKYRALLTMTMLLSWLLAACGGGTQPPTAAAPTATPAESATPTAPASPAAPLTAIRMLDSTQGWALTSTLILRTRDGGHTWQNVTPGGTTINGQARGNFFNSQIAWVATPNENASVVTILYTTNGGQTWSTSLIHVPYPAGVDMPHFIGSQGWIEIITNGGPGAGNESADIWHSADGGASWQRIASTDTPASGLTREGFKSGISFRDALNGWATTSSDTGRPENPGLYVTHDGGKTWHVQTIGYPQGQSAPEQMGTTPPVFFGNTGVLPVHITLSSGQQELVLYVTRNGGNSWTPTTPAPLDYNSVYVIDPQHTWASASQSDDCLVTSNGGQSWQNIKNGFGIIQAFSFTDAANGWAITSTKLLQRSNGGPWQAVNYTIA